ncbi:hypothetical protein BV372_18015 [Nostoc sp. T09]|uniref:DUF1036 domain-containing protein n=1 Tax=Nostoc sp. T09 TaxID=1932621 RepID=UPI000A39D559|nr:DUF1036 domain-containing protein [Nostoc sp. T09]OUL32944.1 hypothetical protein BV372_18015 [Nostoc sp. T09]
MKKSLLKKSCNNYSFAKLASILTLTSTLQLIGFALPAQLTAYAAERNGPVKLCNGDVREETVTAAIMYYSFEKNGWIAQGWYNIAPGKCAYVLSYRGGMFVYGKTPNTVYSGSGSTGFCGPISAGFYGYQKTTCNSNEKFYRGIEIAVPSNGGGFRFTFGNPSKVRDDF